MGSKQPSFCKTGIFFKSNNNMIMNRDTDDFSRLDQLACNLDIFRTRFRIAAGMIVQKYNACRRLKYRRTEYFARMNKRAVQYAGRYRGISQQMICTVEQENFEFFLFLV